MGLYLNPGNGMFQRMLDGRFYVDKTRLASFMIIFGRTNYDKAVLSYPGVKTWYNERVREVEAFCQERGIDCYIKRGTRSAKPSGSGRKGKANCARVGAA